MESRVGPAGGADGAVDGFSPISTSRVADAYSGETSKPSHKTLS